MRPSEYTVVSRGRHNDEQCDDDQNANCVTRTSAVASLAERDRVAPFRDWARLRCAVCFYIYEAKPQKVRQLTFGFPTDMNGIKDTKEEIVDATRDLRLNTTLQSPDGYALSYDGYSHSGLLNEVFWGGGGYGREPRLRKGSSSVRLTTGDGNTYFSYGDVEFVGWVTANR